jgi:AmmeMemoRadiSam system protein A
MLETYTPEEQAILLGIARETLKAAAAGQDRPRPDLATLPPHLGEKRACFVTLNSQGDLRGCTGTLTARRPLADEVSATTVQTALYDPRFSPVRPEEVPEIQIEISVLTPPEPLVYSSPEELLRALRPGIDGVLLRLGHYRSTFLPQVWERYPDPVEFLTLLCRKAGLPGNAWRSPEMQVDIYQTVVFEEHEQPSP